MRIIKIIKNALIHLLGGFSKEERNEWIRLKYYQGKTEAYLTILSEMWQCYGKQADDWCKTIYEFTLNGYYSNEEISNKLFNELSNENTKQD